MDKHITVYYMLHIRPQLGLRFLADSNSWNVNVTPNVRTVRHILRVLSQLASLTMFLHILAYFFSDGYLEPNFKYQIFYFRLYRNMIENRMFQQLQKICTNKRFMFEVVATTDSHQRFLVAKKATQIKR